MDTEKIEQIKNAANHHGAEILVVSKNRANDHIKALYDIGFRKMGENRVQSLLDKKDALPSDIQWHIIGHLQKNKVKYIAEFISMIHSVDSIALAQKIETEAKKYDRIIPVLLQFKVAQEDSKYGLEPENATKIVQEIQQKSFTNIKIRGIMGMASFSDNKEQVRQEFQKLRTIFMKLKEDNFSDDDQFDTLSMGMSGDYDLALEEGSTLLRLGSVLFS